MSFFATFIVPSIGRDTLCRTLKSVVDQTDPDWNALVIGDGLGGNWRCPWHHCKIWTSVVYPKVGFANAGGFMRNHGMRNSVAEWFCFVDDDDRLDAHYVEWLKEEGKEKDLVVFRMLYEDGHKLPPDGTVSLVGGQVGISFAVRAEFQRKHNIWFVPSTEEDWTFLKTAIDLGARGRLSDRVGYYVRH